MSEAIFSGDPNKPQIYLTFDDGPNEMVTPPILDMLSQNKVKATFFALGQHVDLLPHITRRMHEQGHLVSNHTYSHPYLTQIDDQKVIDELSKGNRAIQKVVGYAPTCYRPTYGEYNNKVNELAARLNLTPILWSVDTNDWNYPQVDANAIVRTLLNEVKNGSIILCHDLPNKATLDGLKIAIPELKKRGLNFATVDKLISTTPGAQKPGVQTPGVQTPGVQMPGAQTPAPGRTYTVKPGDYLSLIAEKSYGDGSEKSWRKIYEANKNLIGSNPSSLQVGWVLTIP